MVNVVVVVAVDGSFLANSSMKNIAECCSDDGIHAPVHVPNLIWNRNR